MHLRRTCQGITVNKHFNTKAYLYLLLCVPLGAPGHTQPGWRHGVRGHSQMAVPRHSQTGRDCAGSRTPGGRAMLGAEQRSTQLKPPVHYAFLNTHTRVHTHTHTVRQTDILWASLVAQVVRSLPAMQETWVQSSGWEDPLAKRMATHPSILAWTIPGTEEPGGLQSTGSQEWDMTKRLTLSLFTFIYMC